MREFRIITGCDLGLRLLARPGDAEGELRVSLSWPLEQVMRRLAYAAGPPANNTHAAFRLFNALQPDASAEPAPAEEGKEGHEGETGAPDTGAHEPPAKRRRGSEVPPAIVGIPTPLLDSTGQQVIEPLRLWSLAIGDWSDEWFR